MYSFVEASDAPGIGVWTQVGRGEHREVFFIMPFAIFFSLQVLVVASADTATMDPEEFTTLNDDGSSRSKGDLGQTARGPLMRAFFHLRK